MSTEQILETRTNTNAVTLANAMELIAMTALKTIGKDIADTINNSPVSLNDLRQMSLSSLRNHLKV